MKTGALILSFLFVVLSIQPTFVNWSRISPLNTGATCSGSGVGKTGCCKKMSTVAKRAPVRKPVKQQSENPCDNCNPFMPCNACPYVPEETQLFVPPLIVNDVETTNAINDNDLSGYNAECWHPPELFSHL